MMKSVAVALCAVAGLAVAMSPAAQAQSKTAAAKQWTDCSKVEPAKRDVCIRNLPTVRGPVPIAGAAAPTTASKVKDAAKGAAAKVKEAASKAAAKVKEAVKPAAAKVAGINPSSPCAKVDPSKREACLSRAPATKGPGWAAFASRSSSSKKK